MKQSSATLHAKGSMNKFICRIISFFILAGFSFSCVTTKKISQVPVNINALKYIGAYEIPFNLKYKNTTVMYMADLIPSSCHIPIPYVMGYDMRPLNTIEEKIKILKNAADNNWILFFLSNNQILL